MAILSQNLPTESVLKYKIERVSRLFTQEEIAAIAGVPEHDVSRFERGESIKQPAMRKLIATYDSLDVRGFLMSSPYK